jgi:hypothetical protein
LIDCPFIPRPIDTRRYYACRFTLLSHFSDGRPFTRPAFARHRRLRGVTSTATLHHPWFRCGPAEPSMSRRSVGSTRPYISSKRHPTSPSRTAVRCHFRVANCARVERPSQHPPWWPLLLARQRRAALRGVPLWLGLSDLRSFLLPIYRVFVPFLFHNSKSRFGPSSAPRFSRNELSRHKPRLIDTSAYAFVWEHWLRCCPSA